MNTVRLTFITPLFSRGAYEDRPEVRPSSIRGQLHWWLRALGGNPATERSIFGSVHKDFGAYNSGATASPLLIRVSNVDGREGKTATLPHKHGGQASPKACLLPGTSFDLHWAERLSGLGDQREFFERVLEFWLLAGTLGLRSTRAAGSFQWAPVDESISSPPDSFDSWEQRCRELASGSELKLALLPEEYTRAEEARKVVSDTIGGRDDSGGQTQLERINFPLGKIFRGRKTSPLRFRIIGIGQSFRILAVWDGRTAVTGNHSAHLDGVIELLHKSGKRIGHELAVCPPK